MPHTLSDADTALLLRHLRAQDGSQEATLLPIIHDLESSLMASRSGPTYSTSSSPTCVTGSSPTFGDFLGYSGGSSDDHSDGFLPEDWDRSEGLSDNILSENPDTDYLSDGFSDYISDYFSDVPLTGEDFGVDPSLVFGENKKVTLY
jgi:hypothetical protein